MSKPHLFSELRIRDLSIKNRIVMPAMLQYAGEKGQANDWHHTHYVTRAVGQVGLIITEATAVSEDARISNFDLGIYSDAHIPALQAIVDACHQYGAKIAIQLAHAGRKAGITRQVWAPSSLAFSKDYPLPIALGKNEITKIIANFTHASIRAIEAGFDAIEIHGAHGYLISSFLSPLSNHRRDVYGEDRTLFLREILEAVRKVVPASFPIILRVSARDYAPKGNDEYALYPLLEKVAHLFDALNVSTGGVVEVAMKTYDGYQIEPARYLGEKLKIPVIGGGLITDPKMANTLVKNKVVDAVFLGRELLRNPYWAWQASRILGVDIPIPTPYARAK